MTIINHCSIGWLSSVGWLGWLVGGCLLRIVLAFSTIFYLFFGFILIRKHSSKALGGCPQLVWRLPAADSVGASCSGGCAIAALSPKHFSIFLFFGEAEEKVDSVFSSEQNLCLVEGCRKVCASPELSSDAAFAVKGVTHFSPIFHIFILHLY